jgi:hypothetical protein
MPPFLLLPFLIGAFAQTCTAPINQRDAYWGIFSSSSGAQAFCTPRGFTLQLLRHQAAPGHRLTLTVTAWDTLPSDYGVVFTAAADTTTVTATASCALTSATPLFPSFAGNVTPAPGSWQSHYSAQIGLCYAHNDYSSFDGGITYTISSEACPAGFFCPLNSASPVACAAGAFSVSGATSCAFTGTSCPTGTYALAPASCIASCPAGAYVSAPASCIACGAGEFSVAGAAACAFTGTTCPAGTYASAPASCIACGAGTFSVAGAQSCTNCTGGAHSVAGAASCAFSGTSCPAGTFAFANTSCIACEPGRYSSNGATDCVDCPPQTFASQSGASACAACYPGLYADAPKSAACESCGAGFYAKPGGNFYRRTECAACRNPPLCSASGCVAGNTGDECRFCIPGYYHLSSGFCAPCGSNFYAYALALFFFLATLGGLFFALRRRLEPYFAFLSRLRKRSAFSLTLLFDQLVRLALLHRLSLIPFPTAFSGVLGYVSTSVGLNLASSECVVRFNFDQQYWVTIGVIFFAIAVACALDCHLSAAGLRVDAGQRLVVAVLDALLPLAAQPSIAAFAVTQAKFETGGLISDDDVLFSSDSHRAVAGFAAFIILFFISFLGFRTGCVGNCGRKRLVEFEAAAGEEERESAALSRSRTAIALARDWVGFLRMPSILLQMLTTSSQRDRGATAASVWLLLVSALEISLFVPARKHFLAERSGGALNAALLIFVFLFTHASALACAIRGDGCVGNAALGAVLVALNALLALLILLPVGSDCWRLWKSAPPAQPSSQQGGNVRDFFSPRLLAAGKSPLSASGRHLLVTAFGATFRPEVTTKNLTVAGEAPISASGRHLNLTAFGTDFTTEVDPTVLVSPKPPPRVIEGHCVALLRHGGAGVRALAAVEGGGLASGSESHIYLWAEGLGAPPRRIEGQALALAALPNGRLAAGGWGERSVEVLDAAGSGRRLHQLRGHSGNVNCVAALPGGLFASGGDDKTVRVWDAATGAHVGTLEQPPRWLDDVSFTMRPPMSQVHALAALPNGTLASGSFLTLTPRLWPKEDLPWEGVRVWDVAKRAVAQFLNAGDVGDEDFAWASDSLHAPRAASRFQEATVFALAAIGGRLAGGCSDGAIYLWAIADGARDGLLAGHKGSVASLAALPSGLLASGSWDMTVRLWEVGAECCVAVLRGHGGAVLALAALPDGRLASGAADDPLIRVWALTAAGSPEDAAAAAAAAARMVVAPAELEAGPQAAAGAVSMFGPSGGGQYAPGPYLLLSPDANLNAAHIFLRNLFFRGYFSCAPDPPLPPAAPLCKSLEECALEARALKARAGARGWALTTGFNGDVFWHHAGRGECTLELPQEEEGWEAAAAAHYYTAALSAPLAAPAPAQPAPVLLLPGPPSARVSNHLALSAAGASAAPTLPAASSPPAAAAPAAAAAPGPPAGAAGPAKLKWVQKSGAWIKAATSWRGKGPVKS